MPKDDELAELEKFIKELDDEIIRENQREWHDTTYAAAVAARIARNRNDLSERANPIDLVKPQAPKREFKPLVNDPDKSRGWER